MHPGHRGSSRSRGGARRESRERVGADFLGRIRLSHDDRARSGVDRHGHAILGCRVAARLHGAAARHAPARPAARAQPAVVTAQAEQATARADARLDPVGHGDDDRRRTRAYPHRDVGGRLGEDQPRRGGTRIHPHVGDADVGEIDVELARPGVHVERGRHVAGDLDLHVDAAAAPEDPLRTDLIDPHVGATAALRRPQAEIGALAMRGDEVGRATADVIAARPAVDRKRKGARATARGGHVGVASAPAAEDEDPTAEPWVRGDKRETSRDDEDLGHEGRRRPASREGDVEPDEDQEQRPEAEERAPRDARDEAEIREEEDETERDQKKRPENTAAGRHERTLCTRNSAPTAMSTTGHTSCHWTTRKSPALPSRKITPSAIKRYPNAIRRRSVSRACDCGSATTGAMLVAAAPAPGGAPSPWGRSRNDLLMSSAVLRSWSATSSTVAPAEVAKLVAWRPGSGMRKTSAT